jgi:predicted transcriptional regulator
MRKDLLISKDKTVYEAMRQMDDNCQRVLFVIGSGYRLLGSLTDEIGRASCRERV